MKELSKHWSSILVRGIVAIIFGLVAMFAPGIALEFLLLLFGAFSLIDGVVAFFLGTSTRSGVLMLEGLVGILVGLYIFFFSTQAFVVFILVIAIWAIATGILEIAAGFSLRKYIADEIFLLVVGMFSIIFGFLVFIQPGIFALTLAYIIGIYALAFGAFLVLLAFRLKNYSPARVKSSSSKKKRKK